MFAGNQTLTASRRGQDRRSRRRSAAIPPNELSRENVGNMWQHMATHVAACDNTWRHMWQRNMSTCGNMCACKTNYGNMYGICVLFLTKRSSRPRLEASEQNLSQAWAATGSGERHGPNSWREPNVPWQDVPWKDVHQRVGTLTPWTLKIHVTDLAGGTYSSVHALVGACLLPSAMWSESQSLLSTWASCTAPCRNRLRPDFKSSIWKSGPRRWEIWTFKGML